MYVRVIVGNIYKTGTDYVSVVAIAARVSPAWGILAIVKAHLLFIMYAMAGVHMSGIYLCGII
jgi:hypothetical protein